MIYTGHYILVDKKVERCEDLLMWATWMEVYDKNRIIKQTDLPGDELGGVHVSTVFLGTDHNFCFHREANHRPILFETMIFGGEHHHYQRRYYTYEEALAGHQETIEMIFEIKTDNDGN